MWPLSVVIHGLRAQEAKALIQVHFHLSTIGFGDEHPHRFIVVVVTKATLTAPDEAPMKAATPVTQRGGPAPWHTAVAGHDHCSVETA